MIYIFLWVALPVIMFAFNTFSGKQIKRLVLLYLISAVMQELGIFIHIFLYYNFIGSDPDTSALGQGILLITAILNVILSLIGSTIKGIILKFKK